MNVSEWNRSLIVEELRRRRLLPSAQQPLEVEEPARKTVDEAQPQV
jgi:hypothetical protein